MKKTLKVLFKNLNKNLRKNLNKIQELKAKNRLI